MFVRDALDIHDKRVIKKNRTFVVHNKMLALCLVVAMAAEAARMPRFQDRIVGGVPTTIEQHPYHVGIFYSNIYICGGSIITNTCILTAAHCTDGGDVANFSVLTGTSYLNGTGGVFFRVSAVCQHPDYDNYLLDYDVSVLKLKNTLGDGLVVQLQPVNVEVAVGVIGVVIGWGLTTEEGLLSNQLMAAQLPLMNVTICQTWYPSYPITPRMLCFGYTQGGVDSCQGDSGGGVIVNRNQVGIVSWGVGCARPYSPGVYTKTNHIEISLHINSCLNN